MKKIAAKVAKRLRKEKSTKLIHLDAYKASKQAADQTLQDLNSSIALIEQGYYPAHACYVQAQNLLSVVIEALLLYQELSRFEKLIADADDDYSPGGPPMSPLTHSFFHGWSAFDLSLGLQQETLASIVLDIHKIIGMPTEQAKLIQRFSESRMGLYEHLGFDEEGILLRELGSPEPIHVHNPSGYMGSQGQLWYIRLLPDLGCSKIDFVGFTTPYVLTSSLDEWQGFLARRPRQEKKALSYEKFMKRGLSHFYWCEFVLQAYQGVNSEGTAIFLQGVPDQGESRPHFGAGYSARLPETTEVVV